MITVHLEARTDSETGELGLIVEGAPHVDGMSSATDGLLIAHDLIEHQNGIAAVGGIDDELEALGGIWYARGQHHDLRRDGTGSHHSTEANIAGDVTRMFRDHAIGDAYVNPNVPRTRACEHDDAFREIIAIAAKNIDDIGAVEQMWETYAAVALARMRIGYRKAYRRFEGRGMSRFAANTLVWAIADAVDPYAKNPTGEGARYKLTYNVRAGEAHCEEFYSEDDYS